MKFRKAQAAMEFLMTYGWAILVVLVAIGALAYFGVLNPSRFLPASCTVAPGIGCDEFKVSANGTTVILRNGLGTDLQNVVVTTSADSNNACPGSVSLATWADGTQATFTPATPCVISGTRYRGQINVSYDSNGVSHIKQGQIVTQIE